MDSQSHQERKREGSNQKKSEMKREKVQLRNAKHSKSTTNNYMLTKVIT